MPFKNCFFIIKEYAYYWVQVAKSKSNEVPIPEIHSPLTTLPAPLVSSSRKCLYTGVCGLRCTSLGEMRYLSLLPLPCWIDQQILGSLCSRSLRLLPLRWPDFGPTHHHLLSVWLPTAFTPDPLIPFLPPPQSTFYMFTEWSFKIPSSISSSSFLKPANTFPLLSTEAASPYSGWHWPAVVRPPASCPCLTHCESTYTDWPCIPRHSFTSPLCKDPSRSLQIGLSFDSQVLA